MMLYQAHRGVSTDCPENTMPAFQAAKEQGYPIIELDPLFTADGECVTFHDHTINRTCRMPDGTPIAEEIPAGSLTYEELCAYDAGIFMGQQFAGTKVPLLAEVLDYAWEAGLQVKIDNRFADFPQWQQEKLFDIVRQSGVNAGFTCKNLEITKTVVKQFPQAPIHYDGYVDETTILQIKSLLKDNHLIVWLPLASELTSWVTVPVADEELCSMVKHHAALGLWILETQEQCEAAKAFGADIIETTGALKP